MRRRQFITFLGGAAAWPVAARGQQPEQERRVGILMPFPASDRDIQARVVAFRQELQKLGWFEGGNLRIDERWPTDNMDRVQADAADLLNMKPHVILVAGRRAVAVLQQQTRTVPVVFAGIGDPVEGGVVATAEIRAVLVSAHEIQKIVARMARLPRMRRTSGRRGG
jgi:ABC-type uncharacterized transport system substrate-binding protein